jgi:hypothetical protein
MNMMNEKKKDVEDALTRGTSILLSPGNLQ